MYSQLHTALLSLHTRHTYIPRLWGRREPSHVNGLSNYPHILSLSLSGSVLAISKEKKMHVTLAFLTALAAPLAVVVAQNTTPAPTATSSGAWYETGPPWASDDPAKWSSVYSSLLSDGKIPSTLTAAPWPTGSFGPGQGPWGPGGFHGGGGPGGPGRHWGGKSLLYLSLTHLPDN